MAVGAGLEGLQGLVLETILFKLDARHVAAAACVSTRLRSAASDDALWRRFLARDLDVHQPIDPLNNPCQSFKEAYRAWVESFGMYPMPLVKRAKQCWASIKSWLAVNFPEAYETLKPGVSEDEVREAERKLRFKLPAPTKVLYRFCNGQRTLGSSSSGVANWPLLGIIGGYEFYEHCSNVHLFPLELIVSATNQFAIQHLRFFARGKYITLAISSYGQKFFFLDCSNGQLYVNTENVLDGEWMPCVPETLVRTRVNTYDDMPQDALLLWLEEHSRRLQSGMMAVRNSRIGRSISHYPELLPSCSIAITNGVQVRASAVLVPERSDLSGGPEKYLYSYSIRISLLPEGCMLDGIYYASCQLYSRHWIIKCRDVVVTDFHAEAVIGKYPLLLPGGEEFVYESCTALSDAPGSIEGAFTFVPGRISKPEGRHFDVRVAPFILEEPNYIF